MAFDINTFSQSGMVYGGARPSKFDVQLTVPAGLQNIDPTTAAKLQLQLKAASIPAYSVGEILIPYFGRKIKVAGDRTWDDWHTTIMLDEDYITRALFESWSNSMNRLESNVMAGTFAEEGYKASLLIDHYGQDGSIIREYQMIGGWPRTVGPIVLDWDGTDRISMFEVVWAFDNWVPTASGENTTKSSSTNYADAIDTVG